MIIEATSTSLAVWDDLWIVNECAWKICGSSTDSELTIGKLESEMKRVSGSVTSVQQV